MIRKLVVPGLGIIGVGVAVFMVMQGNRTRPVAQPEVQSARAPFTSYIFGPGIVEASTENIAIGTPVSGIVTAVFVKWGDRVSTGEPLFEVDSSDLQAQVQPALAKVKEAQTNLAKVKNRLRVGESMVPGVSISVEEVDNRRFDVAVGEAIPPSPSTQGDNSKTRNQGRTATAPCQLHIFPLRTPLAAEPHNAP